MPSLTEAAYGASNPIGRYFSIVSTLPALLFTAFSYFVISSGALAGSPIWSVAAQRVGDLSVAAIGALIVVTLAIALVLHPLQFAFVQFLEGYWGVGRFARALRAGRILRYRRIREALENIDVASRERLAHLARPPATDSELALLLSLSHEASRINATSLPSDSDYIMPSRLGNVLRLHESEAGQQYGLDLAVIAPHLSLVADEEHIKYLNDQRTLLDLSVRLCITGLAATVFATAVLWPYGADLLVALIPFIFAYLAYRGSVIVASDYAGAAAVLLDLNRFLLYDRLNVSRPANTDDERRQNQVLMQLLNRDADASIDYLQMKDAVEPAARSLGFMSRLRRRFNS